jgi:hypothetical protein
VKRRVLDLFHQFGLCEGYKVVHKHLETVAEQAKASSMSLSIDVDWSQVGDSPSIWLAAGYLCCVWQFWLSRRCQASTHFKPRRNALCDNGKGFQRRRYPFW